MTRWFALLGMIGLTSISAGCRTPTSITLTITTDVQCADLKGVSIATGSSGNFEGASPVTTTTQCTPLGTRGSRIGTLVVVPSGGNEDEVAIRIVAGLDRPVEECSAGSQYQGCVVARRVIRFQSHVEMQLPIELHLDCKSVACDATSTCVAAGCKSATVEDPQCTGDGCLFPVEDASVDAPGDASGDASDTGAPDAIPEVGPDGCAAGSKVCGGSCPTLDDPAFGCGPTTCSPCDATGDHHVYGCAKGACLAAGCAAGYKDCAGACVAKDAAHGCDATSCGPCSSTNGTASCSGGACKLTCSSGYKLCGSTCVSIDDPNYGCGPTTCDKSTCPATGTLVCSGGACVVGSCGGGTKLCGSSCVPTDASHGCADTGRCTACAAGESCTGSTCGCVAEPKATTCAKVACGVTTNNCGTTVDCGNTCSAPKSCGGGGVPNSCGCTPSGSPCNGVSCGTLSDSCGNPVSCGCSSPKSCSGGTCSCSAASPCNNVDCGSVTDACGVVVSCGCAGSDTCGAITAGKCGCVAAGDACDFRSCGTVTDSCGKSVNCGTCVGSRVCRADCEFTCLLPASPCP